MTDDFKNHTPGGGGRADDLYKGRPARVESESQTVGVEGEQMFDLPNQTGDSRYVTAEGTTKLFEFQWRSSSMGARNCSG